MSQLIPSPFRVARGRLGSGFDELFDTLWAPVPTTEQPASSAIVPPLDIEETENAYIVRAELPGVDKDRIEVTVHDGVLTITGQSREEQHSQAATGEVRTVRRERRVGKFARSLRLGVAVGEDAVNASYRDGVLEIVIPKLEEAKPRRIEVQVQ